MDNSEVLKQYEEYFDLFSRSGWSLFMEDIDSMIDGLDSLDYVNSLEELHSYKGQLLILKRIRGFQNAIEAAYEDLQHNSEELYQPTSLTINGDPESRGVLEGSLSATFHNAIMHGVLYGYSIR